MKYYMHISNELTDFKQFNSYNLILFLNKCNNQRPSTFAAIFQGGTNVISEAWLRW